MALMPPVGCARLTSPLPAQVSLNRRRMIVSANLSSPPQGDIATVDYVKATASFFEQDSRPIMLFDGVCNLCNGGVKFVRDNDQRRKIRFEALQSEAGKKLLQRSGRAPDDISSVVLVEKDRSYIKSEAVLKIMEYIDLPFPQLAFFLQFIPLFVRDFVYENVADNRYNFFGRTDSCEICNKDERGVKFWTRPESMGRMAAYFINACHVRAVILINENRFISFFEGYSWESDNSGRSRTSLMMNNQELQVL